MFRTTPIFNDVNVGEESANADEKMYIVSFPGDIALREFLLKIKTVANATTPGASKDVVVNIYWANERIDSLLGTPKTLGVELDTSADIDAIALALEGHKTAYTYTIVNTASVTNLDDLSGGTILRPLARYAYITYDKPALGAGADVTMSIDLVRIPATTLGTVGNI